MKRLATYKNMDVEVNQNSDKELQAILDFFKNLDVKTLNELLKERKSPTSSLTKNPNLIGAINKMKLHLKL